MNKGEVELYIMLGPHKGEQRPQTVEPKSKEEVLSGWNDISMLFPVCVSFQVVNCGGQQ